MAVTAAGARSVQASGGTGSKGGARRPALQGPAPKAPGRVFSSPEAMAEAVASHVAGIVRPRPQTVRGLATGKTFVPVCRKLVHPHRQSGLSFAEASSFGLDEYPGLAPDHPASFRPYMEDHFFRHVDPPADRAWLPEAGGDAGGDEGAACRAYEAAIAARGGIDMQVPGIGRNGHIGFHEPGAAFGGRTRVVGLAPSTNAANTSDFTPGEVPSPEAITMGIGTILDAREIVLVATGASGPTPWRARFDRRREPIVLPRRSSVMRGRRCSTIMPLSLPSGGESLSGPKRSRFRSLRHKRVLRVKGNPGAAGASLPVGSARPAVGRRRRQGRGAVPAWKPCPPPSTADCHGTRYAAGFAAGQGAGPDGRSVRRWRRWLRAPDRHSGGT